MSFQAEPQAQEGQVLLAARRITKTFDRTRALSGADFELAEGEVHGLLGANGAGKSTLSKVIAGHYLADSGDITYRGHDIHMRSTRDALKAGIAIVMQETSLVPDLTVLENMFLPELGRPGRLDYRRLRQQGEEILEALGQREGLPFDREVRSLSSAQKQLVEIAKALGVRAKLIIFDEPTAALSPGEVDRLFEVMVRLRQSGRGLIFVSHRLEEVFAITDRVTVLREGRTVMAARPTGSLAQSELIRAMVGAELQSIYHRSPAAAEPDTASRVSAAPILFVRNLASAPMVRDVSFDLAPGEIVGLGGLVGAGRSETIEAIFGLRRRDSGTVTLKGRTLPADRPDKAIRAGIGFVAEDRRTQNIVPDFSVRENLLLAHLGAHRGFFCNYRRRERKVAELLEGLGLPPDRLMDASMLTFSGGMQQKVIMARWLLLEPSVLILDEPTKGVDIQTRASIYAMLRKVAASGTALLVVSSDFEELLGLCDRVVVMSDGRSTATLPSTALDEEKLTLLAAPRTSMERNTLLLERLASEFRGAGFWVLLEEDSLICLNSVTANAAANPGFSSGEARPFAQTRIAQALAMRAEGFTREAQSGRQTLLLPLRSPRGHDFGWVGLALPPDVEAPHTDAVRARVDAMAENL